MASNDSQPEHCQNIQKDRDVGAYWERMFSVMAAKQGKWITPLQLGRTESAATYTLAGAKWQRLILPDVTVWTAPTEHHEIKHKNATRHGDYGLEQYRYQSLYDFAIMTGHAVMYTIHDHDLAGGRDKKANQIEHWLTVDVLDLYRHWKGPFNNYSWVNGQRKQVPIYYWPKTLWMPLVEYWRPLDKPISLIMAAREQSVPKEIKKAA